MQRLANHHLRYLPDKSDVANALNPEYGMAAKKGAAGNGDAGAGGLGVGAAVMNREAEGAGDSAGGE